MSMCFDFDPDHLGFKNHVQVLAESREWLKQFVCEHHDKIEADQLSRLHYFYWWAEEISCKQDVTFIHGKYFIYSEMVTGFTFRYNKNYYQETIRFKNPL